MQAEDRPIHFSSELLFPPFQIKVPVLQKLYYELSRTPGSGYDSADFSMPGPPRFHSRRGAKTQSLALFLPDRLVLIEEWVDIPLARFVEKVRAVSAGALDAFELAAFVAQTATVRTTFALTHFEDARVFLLDHVCGQEGRIGPYFARPVGIGGLRFVLPHTDEHGGDLHVIIESYRHSHKEVFVEVKGIFGGLRVARNSLETFKENIECVHEFISNHVYPFLQQYDAAPEGSG